MKTLREFDYDLWAVMDNGKKRYFARIKATGEEKKRHQLYAEKRKVCRGCSLPKDIQERLHFQKGIEE